MAVDLLTNTPIGDGVASITFQLFPFALVRHLSKEYLEPAFVVMSSELAKKSPLLRNFVKGKILIFVTHAVMEIGAHPLAQARTHFTQLVMLVGRHIYGSIYSGKGIWLSVFPDRKNKINFSCNTF